MKLATRPEAQSHGVVKKNVEKCFNFKNVHKELTPLGEGGLAK